MSVNVHGRTLPATLFMLLILGAVAAARAETAYVSDQLIINFRTVPSDQGRIAKLLPSGTPLEIVPGEKQGDYVKVRTRGGDEGWVLEQYLEDQPVAADRLDAANGQVAKLTRNVAELKQQLDSVQGERTQAEQSSNSLTSQVSQLEQELAEIKQVSANALDTQAENQRLNELNARLRDELDALVKERDELASNTRQRWLMIGGGLVLAGVFLGMIVKSRPRRSAWS